MKRLFMMVLAIACLSLCSMAQTVPTCTLKTYTPNDGGILMKLTANGKWGVIELGNSDGGGTANPKLYDVERGVAIEVMAGGRVFGISDVSDDGNIVVGSIGGRPASYNRATNKLTYFPLRPLWMSGSLSNVTPDGKWAVGSYNGYQGLLTGEDESNTLCYSTLLVNVETGDTIATPGLPKLDMAHLDQHAMIFNDITPDGRYIQGMMSWFYLQPNSGFTFIYDRMAKTYRVIGFTEHADREWEPATQYLYNLCDGMLSPDGHWLAGMAYMAEPIEGSQFYRDYGVPYRYDLSTGEIKFFENVDANISSCVVDNAGTLFVNPETGSPLRDFRILYQDKYWISLSQICSQHYGFDFTARTGFARTGSIGAVSGDGSRFIAYPDPLGESYFFDFGETAESVCQHIDLLSRYTVTPVDGSVFSELSSVEINFGRNVQVLGTGKNVHLYKADGTKVCDGLSSGNQGLQLKTGSKTTVNAVFRTRVLEAGQQYYVTIDAGAVAVNDDASITNKEIRINYVGRAEGPVAYTSVAPIAQSKLRQLDASSYILLTFDCPVQLTGKTNAFLQRTDDNTIVGQLSLQQGNTESTINQILLYTSATLYMYEGVEYKVVLEKGSVSDYSGSEKSYNERIEIPYLGTYVRAAENQSVLFYDDFEDPNWSYGNWLRYEGDHRIPTDAMQALGFKDGDNFPWQFGLSDDATYSNMFASSHSVYSPAGQSDDWMMTPQIVLPADGAMVLTFDAQSYLSNTTDMLKVYVYEEEFDIPYLSDEWLNDDDGIRKNAILLDEIRLKPGASEELTAGEWTHYSYDLSRWAGKPVYIAFVNQNANQSAIFVDNVTVERDVLYSISFNNAESVVNQDNISIGGKFTVKTNDTALGKISLVLKDGNGSEVSRVEWNNLLGSQEGNIFPFTFSKPLPLVRGQENAYTVDITMGSHSDVYSGSIASLTFLPVKHVVLEELTGIDCPNCTQGILAIEKCQRTYGDRFIPISIHTYTGDPYAGTLGGYTQFLGLNAAPSARINRTDGIYYPMISIAGNYFDSFPDNPLWYDVVSQELNKPTYADIGLEARLNKEGTLIHFKPTLRSALNAKNRQLSLFVVVLEDGLVNYQQNNLGMIDSPILGEWGEGGSMSSRFVYPVTHNDVARSAIGQTFSGTIGLFPPDLAAGQTYTNEFSGAWPQAIMDVKDASAVAMLIDSQTGEVVNAVKTRILGYDEDAIADVQPDHSAGSAAYTLSGMRVDKNHLKKGIYVIGGRKVVRQ